MHRRWKDLQGCYAAGPSALSTSPRGLHLAIPPVAALSPFTYNNTSGETGKEREPLSTILVIDDEESVRRLFQVALEGAGYRVLTAEHGKHGLRLLEQEKVVTSPQLLGHRSS